MASLLNMSGGSLLKKGLPYDAEIEYLESSGTQWIDTLISANNSIYLKAEIQLKLVNIGADDGIFGVLRDNFDCACGSYGFSASYKNDTGSSISIPAFSGDEFKCFIENGKVVINNNVYSIPLLSQYNNIKHIYLFSTNFGRPYNPASVRVHYLKVWDRDELLIDYIPVRVGNVGYMYDKVSGRLFGNQGTGDFILGPDKH